MDITEIIDNPRLFFSSQVHPKNFAPKTRKALFPLHGTPRFGESVDKKNKKTKKRVSFPTDDNEAEVQFFSIGTPGVGNDSIGNGSIGGDVGNSIGDSIGNDSIGGDVVGRDVFGSDNVEKKKKKKEKKSKKDKTDKDKKPKKAPKDKNEQKRKEIIELMRVLMRGMDSDSD